MNSFRQNIQTLQLQIQDLTAPNMTIYWTYYLSVTALSWAGLIGLCFADLQSLEKIALFLATSFMLYHAISFTHEISHIQKKSFLPFKVIWNLLSGCPFCVPSFIYELNHRRHHGTDYSLDGDGEYLELSKNTFQKSFEFLSLNIILPYMGLIRFGILGPISFFSPRLRNTVLRNFSFMGMKSTFTRFIPESKSTIQDWAIQDLATSAFVWVYVALVVSKILPEWFFIVWGLLVSTVGLLNGIRALAVTHKYQFGNGQPVTYEQHICDGVEIEGVTLGTILFCPIQLQYHMTHHMFPHVPFHNIQKVRTRLKDHFSSESFYHQNVYRGIWHGLTELGKFDQDQSKN
jgi:fatty acid desaturase